MDAFLSKKKALTSQADSIGTNGTPSPSFFSTAQSTRAMLKSEFVQSAQCLQLSASTMDTQSVMPTAAPILLDTEPSNHSPVANRTRSRFQKLDIQTDGDCKTSYINSASLTTIETVSSDTPQPIIYLSFSASAS